MQPENTCSWGSNHPSPFTVTPHRNQNNTKPSITTTTTFITRAIGRIPLSMHGDLAPSNIKNGKGAVLRAQVLGETAQSVRFYSSNAPSAWTQYRLSPRYPHDEPMKPSRLSRGRCTMSQPWAASYFGDPDPAHEPQCLRNITLT
jgi:hypothetical protein